MSLESPFDNMHSHDKISSDLVNFGLIMSYL
jgi:hypothetical protein